LLVERFPQPTHRAIEVLQVELVDVPQGVLAAPALGRSITAGGEQAVQHRNKHDPFQRELELEACQ